jgi:AcrR family transcriptional regulator
MATYRVGEQTKNRILSVSKELFYRNGLGNTTYAQISKKADVNIGTIVYHFKSIENIGHIVYEEILETRHDFIMDKIKDITHGKTLTDTILSLVEYRVNTDSYLRYPNYAYFIGEVSFRSETWDIKDLKRTSIKLAEEANYTYTEDELFMHKLLFLPFASLVVNAAQRNNIKLTAKQICDYHTRVRLLSLNVGEKELQSILAEVDDIASQISISIDDHFNFS